MKDKRLFLTMGVVIIAIAITGALSCLPERYAIGDGISSEYFDHDGVPGDYEILKTGDGYYFWRTAPESAYTSRYAYETLDSARASAWQDYLEYMRERKAMEHEVVLSNRRIVP